MATTIKYGASEIALHGDQFKGKTIGDLKILLATEFNIDPRSLARVKKHETDEGRPGLMSEEVPDEVIVEFSPPDYNKGG